MGGRSITCKLCGKAVPGNLGAHARDKHNVGGHKGSVMSWEEWDKLPEFWEKKCGTCSVRLSTEDNTPNFDCGGTCLLCMARAGDPDCIRSLNEHIRTKFVDKPFAYYCVMSAEYFPLPPYRKFWSFRLGPAGWEFITEQFLQDKNEHIKYVDDWDHVLRKAL